MEAQLQGGLLEIVNEGAAFLRRDPRNREFDIFMPPRLIRQFNLNNGDYVEGMVREPSDHYRMSRPGQKPKPEMEDIMRVNGQSLRPDIIPNKDPSQLGGGGGMGGMGGGMGGMGMGGPMGGMGGMGMGGMGGMSMKRPFEGGDAGESKRMDPGLEQFGVPGGDKQPAGGPLQMFQMKGYGFLLRNGQGLDIFVPPNLIRDFGLKEQDYVFGMIQDVTGEDPGKHRPHLVEVISVNGQPAQRQAPPQPPMGGVGGGEGVGMGAMNAQHMFIDSGVLDLNQKRFGFLRENSAGLHVFVDPDTIRRSNLQQGDRITGRIQLQDLATKRARLVDVLDVNGMSGGAAAAATHAAAAASQVMAPWQGQQPMSPQGMQPGMQPGMQGGMQGGMYYGMDQQQMYAAYAAAYAAYGYQMPPYEVYQQQMQAAVPQQQQQQQQQPPQQQQQQQAGGAAPGEAGDGHAHGHAGSSAAATNVAGRPVTGTVRKGGIGGGPGMRVESVDGRQLAIAGAVVARFGLREGDVVAGGCFELTAPATGSEGDGEGGPSAEPGLYLIDVATARGEPARPVPQHDVTDPFHGAAAASEEAKQVHGLVAETPAGLRLVLQVYGYAHGPPAGPIVVPDGTASAYSLKAGDYVRGLAGPDDAEAKAADSAPHGRKRFALRAVYHVDQGAR